MAGDLTSSAYSLVVLSYATLAFVKYSDEAAVKRARAEIELCEKVWNEKRFQKLREKKLDDRVKELMRKDYDNILSKEFQPNFTLSFEMIALRGNLLMCAIILGVEIYKNSILKIVNGEYKPALSLFEAAIFFTLPYFLIFGYAVFAVSLILVTYKSWSLTAKVRKLLLEATSWRKTVSLLHWDHGNE